MLNIDYDNLNVSKIIYGTRDKIKPRNGKPDMKYRELAERLKSVELPYTLRLKIEPQTPDNLKQSRKNMIQWFWRKFGPHYIESCISEDKGVLWLEVWRGKKWYEPFCGLSRNTPIRTGNKQVTCDNCGETFERRYDHVAPANGLKHNFCSRGCSLKYQNSR